MSGFCQPIHHQPYREILYLCPRQTYYSVHIKPNSPKYFSKVMIHFCRTQMNQITGTWASSGSGFSNPLHWEHSTALGNSNPPPPQENDTLILPRTNSFNSINDGSRCWLDFTSTTKDDLELWWTTKPPLGESFNLTPRKGNLWISTLGISCPFQHGIHWP